MNFFSRFFFLAFILLTLTKLSDSQVIHTGMKINLEGDWISLSNPSVHYAFFSSGSCALIHKRDTLFGGQDFQVVYSSREDSNQIYLDLRERKSGDLITRALISPRDAEMVFTFLKEGANNQQYYDEVGVFSRNQDKSGLVKIEGENDLFVIPEGFRGLICIAYNQPDAGSRKCYEGLTRVFQVPATGILSTSLPEDVTNLAFKHFSFYNELSNKAKEQHYPIYDRSEIQALKEKPENIFTPSQLSQPCFLVLGYNQAPRKAINKLFGRQVEGNVAIFRIDTMYNLLNSDLFQTFD